MKVLLLTIFPPDIGGPATQAVDLCAGLREQGHEPVVVAFSRDRTCLDSYEGTKVYRVQLRKLSRLPAIGAIRGLGGFGRTMAQILRLEAPDVVHCNSVGGRELLSGALCSWYGIPSTVKFASDFVWEWVNRERLRVGSIEEAHKFNLPARALSLLEAYGLRRFSLVWATSRYREGTLRDQLGIDSSRIRVIPNRIRLPGPEYRVDYDQRAARPTYLITGGRQVPHKRLEETLAGVAGLEREDVVLRLYGGGDDRQEARARDVIADLGLNGQVERYEGLRYDEVLNLMATSDVYVSSSIEEGFGISLVEAMAVGLPIVAARTSAVPETVPDRKAGILYESGNVADFVSALGELVDDADLRRSLGEFGHEHAKQFSIDCGVDPYSRLFEDALAA